jgi:hypothetical protein
MDPSMIRQAETIRHATGMNFYTVKCPTCHGQRYADGWLCAECDGEGRVVIQERPVPRRSLRKALFAALAILAFVLFGVWVRR